MFQLVANEILVPGINKDVFRNLEPVGTSNMIMTFYLGTAQV